MNIRTQQQIPSRSSKIINSLSGATKTQYALGVFLLLSTFSAAAAPTITAGPMAASAAIDEDLTTQLAVAVSDTSHQVNWSKQPAWDAPSIGANQRAKPVLGDLDGDGLLDMLVGEYSADTTAFKNTGTAAAPVWTAMPAWNIPALGGNFNRPALADLDGDGDLDALVGTRVGVVAFENTGSRSSPVWTRNPAWDVTGLTTNRFYSPALADLDGDGKVDLMLGWLMGTVMGYQNTGTAAAPVWTPKPEWDVADVGSYSVPALADLNGDGLLDLVVGEASGDLIAYRNTGGSAAPIWVAESAWYLPDPDPTHNNMPGPALADLNGNGHIDLLYGDISGVSSAYENTTLTYTWQPASGTITGSGSTVTFNPPPVTADTPVRINVTVTDANGASVTGAVTVTVKNTLTPVPVISAGPTALSPEVAENSVVRLMVTASDPNGDPLTYIWQPTSGTISGSGSTVLFNPPTVTADTVVRINLTVMDPSGLSATGFVDVTVLNTVTSPPVITTGPSASPSDISELATTQLTVAASDPNGFALSYTWQPQSGTITGSGSSVIFTPPSVTGDTVVRVNVTVTNSAGLSVAGVVNVTVRDVTPSGGTTTTSTTSTTSTPPTSIVSPTPLPVISVSTSSFDPVNVTPLNVVDGNALTGWHLTVLPQWFVLNLGSIQTVSQIMMLVDGSLGGSNLIFTIQASLDNATWNQVYNGGLVSVAPWGEADFSPVYAQFLRITFRSVNIADYATAYEIVPYGRSGIIAGTSAGGTGGTTTTSGGTTSGTPTGTTSGGTTTGGTTTGGTTTSGTTTGGTTTSGGTTTTPTNVSVTLSWQPNSDPVDGYIIYFGTSPYAVTSEVTRTTASMPNFYPSAPSVQYDSWYDFGLVPGNQLCFKLRAYNADGISPMTSPVCTVIQ